MSIANCTFESVLHIVNRGVSYRRLTLNVSGASAAWDAEIPLAVAADAKGGVDG